MKDKRKEAARMVAARYSNHLDMATHKYMKITGLLEEAPEDFQDDIAQCINEINEMALAAGGAVPLNDDQYSYHPTVTCLKPFVDAQEEMLSKLKKQGYRHPVDNIAMEQAIFFGIFAESCNDKMIGTPTWVWELTQLPEQFEALRQQIYAYVDEAGLNKMRLAMVREERDRLQGILDKAAEAYKPIKPKETSGTRKTRVVKALKLSKGSGNTPKIDHQEAYINYVKIVRHHGKERKEAMEILMDVYNYKSDDHVRKELNPILQEVKKSWKKEGKHQFYDLTNKELKKYWKGLIPQTR